MRRCERLRHTRPARTCGFTYVCVLAMVAAIGIGLAALGSAWGTLAQREREEDLLHVGGEYASAIAAYRDSSPGSVRRSPPDLDALVLDDRFPRTRRHIRRLYPDPLRPSRPWGLVADPAGGIAGVYSQSDQAPLRKAPVVVAGRQFPPARRHSDWKFVPLERP
jgi:type II secretory pathway pseudopilin PulG